MSAIDSAHVLINAQQASLEKGRPCGLIAGDSLAVVVHRGDNPPILVSANPAIDVTAVPDGCGIPLGPTTAAVFTGHATVPGTYCFTVDAAESGAQPVVVHVFPREVLDDAQIRWAADGRERSDSERRAILATLAQHIDAKDGAQHLPTLLADACRDAGILACHYAVTLHPGSSSPHRTFGNVALLSGTAQARLGIPRAVLHGMQ